MGQRMMIIRVVRGLLAAALLCCLCTRVLAEDLVWFETPVAEITTGYDGKLTHQRAYYLAFVGPGELQGAEAQVARACAEPTIKGMGAELRQALTPSANRPAKLSSQQEQNADISATNRALLQISLKIEHSFAGCIQKGPPQLADKDFYMTLVQRECTSSLCPLSKSQSRWSTDPQVVVFEALYRWAATKGALEQRNNLNRHYRIKFIENTDKSIALAADFLPIKEVGNWAKADQVQPLEAQQHVDLIAYARTVKKEKISYVGGLVIDATRTDFLRTADVYDNVMGGFILATVTGADKLSTLSDEVARTRLMECYHYRGKAGDAELSSCAGYTASARNLADCLNGAFCAPKLADVSISFAALINVRATVDGLAELNPMPRIDLPEDAAKLVAIGQECAIESKTANAYRCVAGKMIMGSGMSQALTDCATAPALGAANDRVRCALNQLSNGKADYFVGCAQKATAVARATCAAGGTLPPDATRILNCTQTAKTKDSLLTCLPEKDQQMIGCARQVVAAGAPLDCATSLLGGDAGKIAGCLKTSSVSDFTFAMCAAGDKLPPDARLAAQCFQQSPADITATAVCVGVAKLPENISISIGCVVRSNGNALGAGVCLATANLKLSPNQQLILQCLASTGGAPQAFAICVGGQLTMAEMVKCKGKSFGEDDCFGQNNEFQKLAKTLTGKTIGPNSVVGQMLTVEMRPAQIVLAAAQPLVSQAMFEMGNVIDDYKKQGEDVVKLLTGQGGSVERVVRNTLESATGYSAAKKVWKKVFG